MPKSPEGFQPLRKPVELKVEVEGNPLAGHIEVEGGEVLNVKGVDELAEVPQALPPKPPVLEEKTTTRKRTPRKPVALVAKQEAPSSPEAETALPEAPLSPEVSAELERIILQTKKVKRFERVANGKKTSPSGENVAKGIRDRVAEFNGEGFKRLLKIKQVEKVNEAIEMLCTDPNLRNDLRYLFGEMGLLEKIDRPSRQEPVPESPGESPVPFSQGLHRILNEVQRNPEKYKRETSSGTIMEVAGKDLVPVIRAMADAFSLAEFKKLPQAEQSEKITASINRMSTDPELRQKLSDLFLSESSKRGKMRPNVKQVPVASPPPTSGPLEHDRIMAGLSSSPSAKKSGEPSSYGRMMAGESVPTGTGVSAGAKPMNEAELLIENLRRHKAEKAVTAQESSAQAQGAGVEVPLRKKRWYEWFQKPATVTEVPPSAPVATPATSETRHVPQPTKEQDKEDLDKLLALPNEPKTKPSAPPLETPPSSATITEAPLPNRSEGGARVEEFGGFKVGESVQLIDLQGQDGWSKPRSIVSFEDRSSSPDYPIFFAKFDDGQIVNITSLRKVDLQNVPWSEKSESKTEDALPKAETGGAIPPPPPLESPEAKIKRETESSATIQERAEAPAGLTHEKIESLTFENLFELNNDNLAQIVRSSDANFFGWGVLMKGMPDAFVERVRNTRENKEDFDSGFVRGTSDAEELELRKKFALESAKEKLIRALSENLPQSSGTEDMTSKVASETPAGLTHEKIVGLTFEGLFDLDDEMLLRVVKEDSYTALVWGCAMQGLPEALVERVRTALENCKNPVLKGTVQFDRWLHDPQPADEIEKDRKRLLERSKAILLKSIS
ncbi:MAG: hypothetical protein Q7R64_00630 [bacterium]|nr:hypothetical protein [bacterium]